ncbi:putative CmcJ-like methyltransferase [Lojkania enalia]|uniref:CmcJ-like methyltransferase n=1 Tax=Lojkania enalia TaxID=147567 RepID=A0A9P4MYG9_9PLEO|nr:putative CmcJ-like methyltransferase [Didymosphaeria enalia]
MVQTTLQYLARDKLYKTEKPYSAEFEVDESDSVRKTNYILETQPVTVQAIKSSDNFDLDTNGFCVINERTNLNIQQALTDPESVELAYFEEIEAILSRHFPEYRRLEPIELVIRKRDERFPSEDTAIIAHEQPACLTHSDYSVRGAILHLKDSFPNQEKYFEANAFDMINVWRPLVGPNDDWPLAICDFTSIDLEKDVAISDRLHADRVGENLLLHPNKGHRWYYIPGQQPENLLVFRNVDSTNRRARAFHCAFFNPNSQGPPRQSCEVRFVAFR